MASLELRNKKGPLPEMQGALLLYIVNGVTRL